MKFGVISCRRSKTVYNTSATWEEICKILSRTQYTNETVNEYRQMSKEEQANIKDVGGFFGGITVDGSRRRGKIDNLAMVILDADHATPHSMDRLEMLYDFEAFIYTTHKHTPERPRFRVVIPLKHTISCEVYGRLADALMKYGGSDMFDGTANEANRLMFFPSTSKDGEFLTRHIKGECLNPDKFLQHYSSQDVIVTRHSHMLTEDPLEKDGIVGSFCRAYSISEAIRCFLPDIYLPSGNEGRYQYYQSNSGAGAIVYDEDRFLYSHHEKDPAAGRMLNAFDLVRIHKFGHLDGGRRLFVSSSEPSYQAMASFAREEKRVKEQIESDMIMSRKELMRGGRNAP